MKTLSISHSQIEVGAKVIVLMQGASLYKGV